MIQKPRTTSATCLAAAGLVALVLGGCGIGESGIAPPSDRFFFPGGLLADPSGNWLFVVNSNSDLRYNAGTVAAVDLRKVEQDRLENQANPARFSSCPAIRVVGSQTPDQFCCRDLVDESILNCNERGYIQSDATVHIGSFGGSVAAQTYVSGAETVRRLFVAVRAEPSITVIDVRFPGAGVSLQCRGERGTAPAATGDKSCDETWRVQRAEVEGETITLQEEPHSMIVDEGLGALFIAHFGGFQRGFPEIRGVSVLDLCAPEKSLPRLAGLVENVFPMSGFALGVTSLGLRDPGNPRAPLFATSQGSIEVSELSLNAPAPCDPNVSETRHFELATNRTFSSSTFIPNGFDVRGIIESADRERAYVLHRNAGRFDPAAVVILDRRPGEDGQPVNRAMDIVDVCTGPTDFQMHDAGRGPHLFVTCFEGGQIYVIEPLRAVVTAIIEAGQGPTNLVFSPKDPGIAFIAGFADNNISVIDVEPGSPTEYRVVQRLGFPRPAGLAQ